MQGLFVIIIFLCFAAKPCLCTRITTQANAFYNVINYGATGDGQTDDTQAFLKAWKAVCSASESAPTLQIPKAKTFLLQPLLFQGPCNPSTINFQLEGTITAPGSVGAWKWQGNNKDTLIQFSNIKGLVIQGGGLINGKGAPWWDCFAKSSCKRPTSLKFRSCQNLQIKSINQRNSPESHMHINDCKGVFVSNIHIVAPKESPNTDGIDVSTSSNVVIQHSHIETGDDCIAIGEGSSFINITGISCGPGHGISVGSLGRGGSNAQVQEIHVKNCTFTGTENGARIKTWQGGSGYAKKITYEDIILEDAKNPLIIIQNYTDHHHQNGNAVKVSDITFSNFQGTSANENAIKLWCDENLGCTNIVLNQIRITSSTDGKNTTASCINAHGKSSSSNIPKVSCLLN